MPDQILDERRGQIKKKVIFSDNYTWEKDYEGNHRLYNTETRACTIWLKSTNIAVLDDRMVLPEFFSGLNAPVESILQWQRYPAIDTKFDLID